MTTQRTRPQTLRQLASLLAWVFLLACSTSCAVAAEPLLIRSQSGQFAVGGLPLSALPLTSQPTSAVSYVRVDPAVLVVALERTKQTMLEELGMADEWVGAINVWVHPVREDDEPIRVISLRYADRWGYRLEVPERVERKRLLKATMQVLLMEIANRRAGPRQADTPPWLAEGLLGLLEATRLTTLTLEPQTTIIRGGRKRDPLQRVRECLRTNAPITLNELNLPTEELRFGANAEVYECCAHLFVHELMRLKNGRACLRDLLALLPEYLNWQTAFLRAFEQHFPRLLDVDKWWSLNLVSLTGRDLFSLWPAAHSWDKLREVLTVPIQVRVQTNDLPIVTETKLQTVVAQWKFPTQAPLLRQKVEQLHLLQPRVLPELAGLVAAYRQVLTSYLENRSRAGLEPKREDEIPPRLRSMVKQTIERLDELDAQRQRLRARTLPAQGQAGP